MSERMGTSLIDNSRIDHKMLCPVGFSAFHNFLKEGQKSVKYMIIDGNSQMNRSLHFIHYTTKRRIFSDQPTSKARTQGSNPGVDKGVVDVSLGVGLLCLVGSLVGRSVVGSEVKEGGVGGHLADRLDFYRTLRQ
jgi:hypothetical protein